MDELVVVKVVGTEPEAELLCSLLRSAGIECAGRQTNLGAGAADGMPGGPYELVVRPQDLEMLATSCGNATTRASGELVGRPEWQPHRVALLPPLLPPSAGLIALYDCESERARQDSNLRPSER
jgi:hypothetical protein